MSINPLTPNLIHLFNSAALSTDPSRLIESEGNFADILAEAFGATSHTDAVDKLSSVELLLGESDDLSGLMIDMQKAELSLNLALQIRNKVIDAYNEVMRMSV